MRVAVVVRTAALVAMTCAAVFSLIRVLAPTSFLPALIGVALVAHLCAAATRRAPAIVSTPVMVVLGTLVCIGASHGNDTTAGLPTTSTFEAIGSGLSDALRTLREAAPPVPPEPGLLLMLAAAVWVAAWSADRLTFVHDAAAEATVPSATIFVVVTALAADTHRWIPAGLYAATVAVHLVAARQLVPDRAVETTDPRPRWRPVAGGVGVAFVAIVVGLASAATIPALDFPGVAQIREDRSIEVTPPLIDLRDQLVDPTDEELFRTSGGGAHYWRLTTYDSFDGSRWRLSPSRSRRVDGPLAGDPTSAGPGGDATTTTFELTGLGGTFAPSAFRPEQLVGRPTRSQGRPAPRVRWDPENLALVVGREDGGVEGLTYTVSSRSPSVDPALLTGATGLPDGIEHYTELPRRARETLAPRARAITGDTDDPYAQALALQNHFRDHFTYSTDLTGVVSDPDHALGESTDAVLTFLETRVGYCVHFAGAYAALARSIGLPARVAVGFTPGEPIGDDPADRIVRGRNAHVWPEVYFAGVGWLPFEPSPGRGNADAATYTGVDGVDDPNRRDMVVTPGSVPPTTGPDGAADPDPAPATPTTTPEPPDRAVDSPASAHPGNDTPGSRPLPLVVTLVLVALAIGATPPLLRALLRGRRRSQATSPAKRVRLAWTDTLDAWYDLDLRRSPVDTDRDLGERLATRADALAGATGPGDDARRLSELATAAGWNATAIDDDDVVEARASAARLVGIARAHRSRSRLVASWFVVRYRGRIRPV